MSLAPSPRSILGRPALVVALLGALVLGACQKDVYSNLSEHEANQMMAVLMSNGIPAQKQGVGEVFTLTVEEGDMLQAISVLNDKGFPKNQRASIGSVFQKSGIISSPFEERVRYIYALGEDVAQTVSEIDGVVTARVHIVLPEEPQLGQPVKPSSAAVFIKHEPSVDLEFFVPQIRRLVSSSIEGLDYAAVTVVLAEASPTDTTPPPSVTERTVEVLPGLAVREADVGTFWMSFYVVVGLLATMTLVIGAFLFVGLRARRRTRKAAGAVVSAEPAMEPS